MTVQDLMDAAKKRNKIRSDLELSKRLEVTQGTVWAWRVGRTIPKPMYAYRLAEMAGLDPKTAVLDMLQQSEKDPKVKGVLEQIQKCVAATAAALLITVMPYPADPQQSDSHQTDENLTSIYIMRIFERFKRRSWSLPQARYESSNRQRTSLPHTSQQR